MAFTPKLTYKGKPLVRKDNELYYGRMTDPYVLYLQILTTLIKLSLSGELASRSDD